MNKKCIFLIIVIYLSACNSNDETSKPFNYLSPQSIGIDFIHNNGHKKKFKYPEIMGGGLAVLDYDLDGDLDIYFVQSGLNDQSDQLYKSMLMETGTLTFTNATKQMRINQIDFGLGASIGDYNNDSYPDILISNTDSKKLLKNVNGKYFEDVTLETNLNVDSDFSVYAAFADLNNDGWQDIVSINNIIYNEEHEPVCQMVLGVDYCGPSSYDYKQNTLYQNINGRFTKISNQHSNMLSNLPSLALLFLDVNMDGLKDIYIANDEQPNTLWLNLGNFRFEETALSSGIAVNGLAKVEASMGIALGDIDKNGLSDMYLSHMWKETNTLYMQEQPLLYSDKTNQFNLSKPSYLHTGFGTQFIDFENDGDLDLVVANGAVIRVQDENMETGYSELNSFYKYEKSEFKEMANSLTSEQIIKNSRGLIRADLDNDGFADIVVSNINNSPEIYLNRHAVLNNWLGFRVYNSNKTITDNIDTYIEYGEIKLHAMQTRVGSYTSSSDPRVLLGVGEYSSIVSITVKWPNNQYEKFIISQLNQYHNLVRGHGVKTKPWKNKLNEKNANVIFPINNSVKSNLNELFKIPLGVPQIRLDHLNELYSNEITAEFCFSLHSYELTIPASICYKKYFENNANKDFQSLYLAALNEINKFDFTLAHHYLDESEIFKNNDWFLCFRRTQIYIFEKKLSQATLELERCSSMEINANNYKLTGDIALSQGDYKKAFNSYREALKLQPNANNLYYQIAESLKYLKKDDMVQLALAQAGKKKIILVDSTLNILSQFNKDPQYHYNKALLFNANNDLISAISALKIAHTLSPNNEAMIRDLSLLLVESKNISQALSLLKAKMPIFKQYESFVVYGSILLKSNEINQSLSVYKNGLEIFPNNVMLLTNTANNYFRLKNYTKAKFYYEQILIIEAGNSNALAGIKEIEKQFTRQGEEGVQ